MWARAARTAIVALWVLPSVDGWARQGRMVEDQPIGNDGLFFDIDHSGTDTCHSSPEPHDEAGVVYSVIQGGSVGDTSNKAYGDILKIGVGSRLFKHLFCGFDLLMVDGLDDANLSMLSGENYVGQEFYSGCWRSANVLEHEREANSCAALGIKSQFAINLNINRNPSPLGCDQRQFSNFNGVLHIAGLGSGIFLNYLHLALAGLPQSDGREPQADGRESENYREGSDDGLVVVVSLDEVKSFRTQNEHPSKEGGALFLICLMGGLFVVWLMYQTRPRP